MGGEANVKKDRTCKICGDIRLRTAQQMRNHAAICKEAQDITDRLHDAGLYTPGDFPQLTRA